MSERRLVTAAALLLVAAQALAAQQARDPDARTRVLLARADSLNARVEAADSARRAEVAAQRRARLASSGDLTIVVWSSVPTDVGAHLAEGASALLDEFGAIPAGYVRRVVAVQALTVDTAGFLSAPAFRGRRRLLIDWATPSDTSGVSWRIASRVAQGYRRTLHQDWHEWLPGDYGLGWTRERNGEGALRTLADDATFVGRECLAGKADACRLWLGVDRDARPFAVRYRPDELRRLAVEQSWDLRNEADYNACQGGANEACVRLAERRPWLSDIPAPDEARRSLIRAVHALHGAPAVAAALTDTAGSVGTRLARASGVSEDSLMAEWRNWTLSRGRTQRVRAGFGDAASVLATTAVLLIAAARSGRWR